MPAKPVKRKKAPQFRRPYLRSKIKVLVSIALLVAGLLVFRTWHKFVTEEAQLDAEVAAKSHHYAQPHVAPAAVEEQSRSLSTGTRLQPDVFTDGHGVLTVENYSGEDAVLKVVVSSTKRPIRKVFIQRNSRVDIHGIEEGAYRILFTMGEDWDDSTEQFTREESYYEFGKILFFEETRESDGIRYSTHEITLNTTIGGNVPRVEISRQEFLAE